MILSNEQLPRPTLICLRGKSYPPTMIIPPFDLIAPYKVPTIRY
jgi:hypothetical protein